MSWVSADKGLRSAMELPERSRQVSWVRVDKGLMSDMELNES